MEILAKYQFEKNVVLLNIYECYFCTFYFFIFDTTRDIVMPSQLLLTTKSSLICFSITTVTWGFYEYPLYWNHFRCYYRISLKLFCKTYSTK